MKIVKPSVSLVDDIDGMQILRKIEKAGRLCYKSEDKITDDSCLKFIKSAVDRGHESLIEHVHVTVRVVCDRGVTHEIVRHRLANYSQESTRYCNYSQGKYGSEITVILPLWFRVMTEGTQPVLDIPVEITEQYTEWEDACRAAEKYYLKLLEMGQTPQQARSVLPNSLKTEIVITFNLREWIHFFRVRAHKAAHPQMQEIAHALLKLLKGKIPVVFDEFKVYDGPLAIINGE